MTKVRLALKYPAVCDNCSRSCITLDQNGIACWHCKAGAFVHRRFWVFWLCRCKGYLLFCPECHGRGVVAVPDEYVTDADLVEQRALQASRARS